MLNRIYNPVSAIFQPISILKADKPVSLSQESNASLTFVCMMSATFLFLLVLNALAFLFYGINCMYSEKMTDEFNRFGLSTAQRKITGSLQVLGAIGLLAGYFYPYMGLAAALGLTVLMLLGFGIRLKIRDSFMESAPSFLFMILNGYIAFYFAGLVARI